MNQANDKRFVPALPDDDENNENESISNDNSVKIYEGVAECTVNESDTFKNVKLRAKDLAKDNVQKKIADYVYSFLKDRLLSFPDDEILSIAKEISNITDVKYNVQGSDDDIVIRATVTAQIDDNDIMNYIIKCFQEREELKSQNESFSKEIEDLKHQISELKQKLSESKYQTQVIELNTKSKEDLAWKLYCSHDFSGALELYNELIKLAPNNAGYYFCRGRCYEKLGNTSKAQADKKKYSELRK